jgi:hypothetical protein
LNLVSNILLTRPFVNQHQPRGSNIRTNLHTRKLALRNKTQGCCYLMVEFASKDAPKTQLALWIPQSNFIAALQAQSSIMFAFLLSFLVLPVTWAAWSVYTLSVNYAAAKKIGVPIVILPVSSGNPVWMLLADIIVPLLQKNSSMRSWPLVRFGRRSWEFKDKGKIHQEIGDLFVMVTPVKNWLYVCNADTLAEIMQRRNEFIRPKEILGRLLYLRIRERALLIHNRAVERFWTKHINSLWPGLATT